MYDCFSFTEEFCFEGCIGMYTRRALPPGPLAGGRGCPSDSVAPWGSNSPKPWLVWAAARRARRPPGAAESQVGSFRQPSVQHGSVFSPFALWERLHSPAGGPEGSEPRVYSLRPRTSAVTSLLDFLCHPIIFNHKLMNIHQGNIIKERSHCRGLGAQPSSAEVWGRSL